MRSVYICSNYTTDKQILATSLDELYAYSTMKGMGNDKYHVSKKDGTKIVLQFYSAWSKLYYVTYNLILHAVYIILFCMHMNYLNPGHV